MEISRRPRCAHRSPASSAARGFESYLRSQFTYCPRPVASVGLPLAPPGASPPRLRRVSEGLPRIDLGAASFAGDAQGLARAVKPKQLKLLPLEVEGLRGKTNQIFHICLFQNYGIAASAATCGTS